MSKIGMTIENINKMDCTGCLSCLPICPKKAISYQYDNEGFWFPVIDKSNCVHCGLCYSSCPINKPVQKYLTKQKFVLQLKDSAVLQNSASGGVFYGMALSTISSGGDVVGCVLNERMLPVHVCANNRTILTKMQGSKYVQSLVCAEVYQEIENELQGGKKVLFSGTPCQIAGLKNYLYDRDTSNLFTIELICHGVGSPGVYLHYITKKAAELNDTPVNVLFRSRKVGNFPNNHSTFIITKTNEYCVHSLDDPYGSSFYHNRILRESCYRCRFASRERVGDLTVGDFEPDDELKHQFPNSIGYSIVLVNTEKGMNLLNNSAENFFSAKYERAYEQINLIQPTLRPADRSELKKAHVDMEHPIDDIGITLKITVADRIKRILPDNLKNTIKKMLRKVYR